jgi:hypothetical protein
MDQAAEVFARALALLDRRRARAALRHASRAETLGFDPVECAALRWQCSMLLGDWENAWTESDRIAASGRPDPHRFWDGRCWSGRRLLIRGLHGLGDTLQFIRYASLLRSTARFLAVQVHPQLVSLIRQADGVDLAFTWNEPDPEWDVQMEITELPRAFRTGRGQIPANVPYLAVPDERMSWARSLIGLRQRPRIGLSWTAGAWNPCRSISLDELEPLFRAPCDLFCLQKGARIAGSGLHELESFAKDILDTAALIQQLDLVITVDTMTAHLAGALGVPVWILLPYRADWRWMLRRDDSPWYPTARLFRQSTPGDWRPVVETITARISRPVGPSGRIEIDAAAALSRRRGTGRA